MSWQKDGADAVPFARDGPPRDWPRSNVAAYNVRVFGVSPDLGKHALISSRLNNKKQYTAYNRVICLYELSICSALFRQCRYWQVDLAKLTKLVELTNCQVCASDYP